MLGGRWLSVLIGALLTLSLTAPAHAGVCSDLLLSTKTYFLEIRESKGLRLLAAPARTDEPRERFYGFVSKKGWPSPLHGLNSLLVDKPVDAIVHGLAGPKKKASLLAKLPAIVGWVLLAQVYVVNPVTEHAFEARIQSEILENKIVFDQLIQDDYRFEPIRSEWASGLLAREEAEEQAYMVSRAYSSYYHFRDGKKGIFTDADNAGLLNHYLFGHLRPVLQNGVEVPAGFEKNADFKERVTEEQSRRLFKLTHALYFRYQMIDASINGASPELAGLIMELRSTPFYQKLEALKLEKKIPGARFERALQEHYFWDYRLRCYETLGLVKLNPESKQPVILDDYDAEILADLER